MKDDFDIYDFSEFTEDDFAEIDRVNLPPIQVETKTRQTDAEQVGNGGPALTVELEHPLVNAELQEDLAKLEHDPDSPLGKFRKRHPFLSVTDLSGLAWCEVQFDYGLRQKRFLKVEKRPASFTTKAGKKIDVQKEVAVRKDVAQIRGQQIHKALEREIRPVEIQVRVKTEEQRWALRLVNMLSCLQSLQTLGCAREMPIFGLMEGQVLIGVIDEIIRKDIPQSSTLSKRPSQSIPGTPTKSKKSRPDSAQSPITNFSPPTTLESGSDRKGKGKERATDVGHAYVSVPRASLLIIDTKTRSSNTIPPWEDTQSARMQVSIYHFLLSSLLSLSPRFDFTTFWIRLKLDENVSFSDQFLQQAGLVLHNTDGNPISCLRELVLMWYETVSQLNIMGVDKNLQIIYRRSQPKLNKNAKRDRVEKPRSIGDLASVSIQASASSVDLASVTTDKANEIEVEADLVASVENSWPETEEEMLLWAIEQSLLDQIVPPSGSGSTAVTKATSPAVDKEDESSIIGIKEFSYDEKATLAFVENALLWWRGLREPKGVDVQQTHRCNSCEYREGCEWREAQAEKEMKALKARKQ